MRQRHRTGFSTLRRKSPWPSGSWQVGTSTWGAQFQLSPWDPERLLAQLVEGEAKAASLDAWKPRHWRILTRKAVAWLARLLTLVESGPSWPCDGRYAQAVCITKPTTRLGEPMCFRSISVLSLLFRVRARNRLEDLHLWIATWATHDMFAIAEHTDATTALCRSA